MMVYIQGLDTQNLNDASNSMVDYEVWHGLQYEVR